MLLVVTWLAKCDKVAHDEPKRRIDLHRYNVVDFTGRLCTALCEAMFAQWTFLPDSLRQHSPLVVV